MTEKLHVLVIEDSKGDSRLIQEMLLESKSVEFDVQRVEFLKDGLDRLYKFNFDVVLLDLALPDSVGVDTLLAVRHFKSEQNIIVMTGLEDEAMGLQATLAGAQDYIVKGQVSSQVLIRAIRYSIERKRFEKKLEHMATHDSLTGLPNRQLFDINLQQALQRARREKHNNPAEGNVAVMLLDLDNFKQVNDVHGHVYGDKLLCSVAERLKNCMRSTDTVARMGGDEFTLVIEAVTSTQDCIAAATKVLHALQDPIIIEGKSLHTSVSIGISLFPRDGQTAETLLQYSDIAMYHAKKSRHTYKFYSDEPILVSE